MSTVLNSVPRAGMLLPRIRQGCIYIFLQVFNRINIFYRKDGVMEILEIWSCGKIALHSTEIADLWFGCLFVCTCSGILNTHGVGIKKILMCLYK